MTIDESLREAIVRSRAVTEIIHNDPKDATGGLITLGIFYELRAIRLILQAKEIV